MLSWVSPVLGWSLKCLAQGHSQEKNPEDPVQLKPRTPGLRVKHFTTEPHRTLGRYWDFNQGSRCRSPVAPNGKSLNKWLQNQSNGESTGDK